MPFVRWINLGWGVDLSRSRGASGRIGNGRRLKRGERGIRGIRSILVFDVELGGVKDDEVGRGRNVSSFCSVVSVVSYRGFREDGSQCGNSLEHTWISVDWTS